MWVEQIWNRTFWHRLRSCAALPAGDDGHLNRLARWERDDQRLAFHADVTTAGYDGDGARAFLALERHFAGDIASCGCSLGFRRLALHVRLSVGTCAHPIGLVHTP